MKTVHKKVNTMARSFEKMPNFLQNKGENWNYKEVLIFTQSSAKTCFDKNEKQHSNTLMREALI